MAKATISVNDRLKEKSALNLYTNYLMYRYKFSRVVAESLYKDILFFALNNSHIDRTDGQIIYQAVKHDEPAGKPLKDCQYENLKLTLRHPDDDTIREKQGKTGLRQHRLRRISDEAVTQGGPLTQEDLANILDVDRSTIIRDIAILNKQGIEIITRSHYTDQGRGKTHKERIIKLFLQGFSLTEIVNRSKHALDNVQRYIYDFLRVSLLYQEDKAVLMIARLAKVSKALTEEYIDLYEQLQSDALYSEPLQRQLSFFASQLELSALKKRGMI
jgi:hypothetical protein